MMGFRAIDADGHVTETLGGQHSYTAAQAS